MSDHPLSPQDRLAVAATLREKAAQLRVEAREALSRSQAASMRAGYADTAQAAEDDRRYAELQRARYNRLESEARDLLTDALRLGDLGQAEG